MAAADSPQVIQAASAGAQWAVKLRAKGWRSLTKLQKAQARSHGVGPVTPATIVPKVTRLINGNPGNVRRRNGEPGNAMKSMTITKQEYLGTVSGGSGVRTFILDPRNVRSFPQLSAFCLGYNKYKFTKLAFRYSPRVNETNAGIICAYTSDSSDEAPKSKYQMYSITPRYEAVASKPLIVSIPPTKEPKFLRDKSSDDAKLVDSGSIHCLIDGDHDGKLGEIFLDLTVVLSEPTFNQCAMQEVTKTRHIKGPGYVVPSFQDGVVTLTFQASGSYLCTYSCAPISSLSQTGMEEAARVTTTSTEESSGFVEVVTEEPLSCVKFTFVNPASGKFHAYVTRM
nr:coat protein [Rose yellow leaf virus]